MKPKRLFKSGKTNYMYGGEMPTEINLQPTTAHGLTVPEPQYTNPQNNNLKQYTQQGPNQPFTVTDDQLFSAASMGNKAAMAGNIGTGAGIVAGVASDAINVDYDAAYGNEVLGTYNYGNAGQHTVKGALKGVQTGVQMGSMFGPIGMGIGAAVGGIGGAIMGGKRASQEREAAQEQYNNALNNHFDNIDKSGKYGGRLLSNYDRYQAPRFASYKNGGDLTQFQGLKHEQGGIQLPGMGAEVEDGETSVENYVFSDSLFLDKNMIKDLELSDKLTGKSFADVSKALNKKFPRENDMFSDNAKSKYFERLKNYQESVRPKDPQGLYEFGGELTDKDRNRLFRQNNKYKRQNDRYEGRLDYYMNNNENNTPRQIARNKNLLDKWDTNDALIDTNNDLLGDYQPMSNLTSASSYPNNTTRNLNISGINDKIGVASRFAPIITSGINLGRSMRPTESLDLNEFNTAVPIEENLVNRDKIFSDIDIAARGADRGLINASGGNASTYLANRLGLLDRALSAKTNARISADTADTNEKARVTQLRLGQSQANQRNRMIVQNMNDQDKGVREGQIQDNIANLGNQLGDFGTENMRFNSVNSMYDYKIDRNGNIHYKNKK